MASGEGGRIRIRGQRSGRGGVRRRDRGRKWKTKGKNKSGSKGIIGERKLGTWGGREGGKRAEGKVQERKK